MRGKVKGRVIPVTSRITEDRMISRGLVCAGYPDVCCFACPLRYSVLVLKLVLSYLEQEGCCSSPVLWNIWHDTGKQDFINVSFCNLHEVQNLLTNLFSNIFRQEKNLCTFFISLVLRQYKNTGLIL
jgi:hypothetical protein